MLVVFLAYIIKGVTGFGTAIIIVSLGSLLIGTYEAVILNAMIDTIGGLIFFYRDPVKKNRSFWVPISVAMIIGSIAGGIMLKYIPLRSFDFLLGVFIIVLGFWFIFGRGNKEESTLEQDLPSHCTRGDLSVSVCSGLFAGLFAVGGPPIVYWLGKRFAKNAFRRILLVVFFLVAVARLLTYGATGLLNMHLVILTIYSLPGIVLGIIFGNRIFTALSERSFSRVIGVMLTIFAMRLLLK